LQDADLAAYRLGELVVAGLLGGHRVRAAHAVVVGAQLRPEHREHQQPQRAERQPEPAEHDADHRAARPRGAGAPRPPGCRDAQPDRHRREQQGQHGHVDPASQVAEPERQAEQAEHRQRKRHEAALALAGIGRWQLPPRGQHPSGFRPAATGWLVSGHRPYSALSAEPAVKVIL
jgi:hypothetical protein